MSANRRNIWVVVMAGGDGQRLRALTTNARGTSTPMQYCSLNGGRSLLQASLQRALAVTSREHIVTVVAEAHRHWWEHEFLAQSRSAVVVEPCNRGTGLGILLPLLVIAKSDPEAGVVFIPSDHYVEHEEILAEYLREAIAPVVTDSDKLTLLGISPNAPDSGFGYLSPAPDSGVGMRPVLEFVEKPHQALAAQLISAGSVWNSGIVAGRISQFVELYPHHTRPMLSELQAIVEHWPDSRVPSPELASLYARRPAFDFSSDVLQRWPRRLQFLVVPPCGWNDLRTPEHLADALQRLRSINADDFRLTASRTFNLATAFDGAVLKPVLSPGSMIDGSYVPLGQGSFVPVVRFPRLSPYKET
jgi:mannose-1-phosphate guanylyltransferase